MLEIQHNLCLFLVFFTIFESCLFFVNPCFLVIVNIFQFSLLDVFIDNIHIRHESIPFYQKRRIYKLY